MENAVYDAASRENQTLKYIRADNEIYTRKEKKRIEEAKVMLGIFKMKGLMKSETFDKALSAFESKSECFHNTAKVRKGGRGGRLNRKCRPTTSGRLKPQLHPPPLLG